MGPLIMLGNFDIGRGFAIGVDRGALVKDGVAM